MGVLAVAAVVVPVEFVVVAAAALAAAAAVADLARKAVGTLRKTQVEERCDVAAVAAAVFVVVVAAAVVAVVVVSEDMVVAAEHAMSWAWAFFAAHLHLQVLRGNYCFGYCSSYGGSAYGTPSSFGDQLG